MKKKLLWLLLIPIIGGGGFYIAQSLPAKTPQGLKSELASLARTEDQEDLEAFDQVLAQYVTDEGLVDYEALKGDRELLDAYNASIALIQPETFESWSEPQQIAYLINAYNSLTLKAIIAEEPIKDSIRDIIGVWNLKRHPLKQSQITLNDIEHEVLRKDYNEPRIHAALVCAALSCPYLRTEAFRADSLDEQLDDQVRVFLDREEAFKIDREKNEVQLSQIFKWFGEDWIPTYGVESGFAGNKNEQAVLNFISGYLSEEDKNYLQAGGYEVTYSFYDWSLNRQS